MFSIQKISALQSPRTEDCFSYSFSNFHLFLSILHKFSHLSPQIVPSGTYSENFTISSEALDLQTEKESLILAIFSFGWNQKSEIYIHFISREWNIFVNLWNPFAKRNRIKVNHADQNQDLHRACDLGLEEKMPRGILIDFEQPP